LWSPDTRKRIFAPYDRIFDALAAGQAEFGVIIHESRFTFETFGFTSVVDLGAWWEETTGLPIPLGGIAARKSLGEPLIEQVDVAVNTSIRRAMADPQATVAYVRQHAQEMDDTVLQTHIHTFVNDFSLNLTAQGRRAIERLESMARKAGAI
jgi:1,4-dihydroxy-6-naphthoate synthase